MQGHDKAVMGGYFLPRERIMRSQHTRVSHARALHQMIQAIQFFGRIKFFWQRSTRMPHDGVRHLYQPIRSACIAQFCVSKMDFAKGH